MTDSQLTQVVELMDRIAEDGDVERVMLGQSLSTPDGVWQTFVHLLAMIDGLAGAVKILAREALDG